MASQLIRFFCYRCGEKIAVAGALAGKRGKCPTCASILMIPSDDPAQAPLPLEPVTNLDHSQEVHQAVMHSQRCESCGSFLSSIATVCPSCGNDCHRKSTNPSVDNLRSQLAMIDADAHHTAYSAIAEHESRKAAVVEMVAVPNNKDEILELLSLATSNGDVGRTGTIGGDKLRTAWRSKAKQLIGKAQVFASKDPEYRRILAPFENTVNKWAVWDRMEWVWLGIALAVILTICVLGLMHN